MILYAHFHNMAKCITILYFQVTQRDSLIKHDTVAIMSIFDQQVGQYTYLAVYSQWLNNELTQL